MADTVELETPMIVIGEEAIIAGGRAGGKYLDSIGETDLKKLTKLQFRRFITIAVFMSLHRATDDAVTAFIQRLERMDPLTSETIGGTQS